MRATHAVPPGLAALLVATAGCSTVSGTPQFAPARPVATPASATVSNADAGYATAAAAINRGDYARALDLLQLARARSPDDVRVLNAFGVVYDKLGRFDLSQRYYRQAQQLEPASAVVAANLAYSEELQVAVASFPAAAPPAAAPAVRNLAQAPPQPATRSLQATPPFAAPRPAAAPTPAATGSRPVLQASRPAYSLPAPPLGLTRSEPTVVRLRVPVMAATTKPLPLLTGHRLVLLDATGRSGGAEPARRTLVRLGWSAPAKAAVAERRQARTTIRYARPNLVAALALARTLPGEAQLVVCTSHCPGLQLTVGADARTWSFRNPVSKRRS